MVDVFGVHAIMIKVSLESMCFGSTTCCLLDNLPL